jgi:hypothetical protein
MKNLKVKLILVMVLSMFVLSFTSCEKEETETTIENDYGVEMNNSRQTTFEPDDIGQMHNELLDRFYEEFVPNYHPEDSVILNINELLDFLFKQPEASSLTDEQKSNIRSFYISFKSKGDGSDTFNNFIIYLEDNVGEIYDASYTDILEGNITGDITQEVIDVHKSIKSHSELYWSQFNNTRACVSCADAAAGAWGFFFGGVGSFVAGATASIIAERVNNYDGPTYVFDGEIHTPKDI